MTRHVQIFIALAVYFITVLPTWAQSQPSPISPATASQTAQAPSFVPVGSVTFYSHSFGENFPHAFVIVETLNAQNQIVYDAFGFSAKHLNPKILWGRVDGHIAIPGDRYIRQSDPHFTVLIDAQGLSRLYQVRANWEGSRYHLNKHNCVHFVAELANSIGLQTNWESDHFKEPASFLREVFALNPGLQNPQKNMSIPVQK